MRSLFVLNEKEYIKEMLDCRKKIDNISNNYLITLIAKYYYDKSKTVEELISLVKENMLVSSKGLLSGIPFNNSQEFSEFKDTVISRFINENIKKELFQDKNQTRIIEIEKDIIKSKQYKINYFDIL